MKKYSIFSLLFSNWISIFILFISTNVLANNTLGIGTSYIPEKIELLESKDLITNIIQSNILMYAVEKEGEPKDNFKPHKISRTVGDDVDIWKLEYTNQPPLSKHTVFGPEIIEKSIPFFLEHQEILKNKDNELTIELLKEIKKISINQNTANGFNISFEINKSSLNFINTMAKVPLVDYKLAHILKKELGKNTSVPAYGRYFIKDRSTHHLHLAKNSYFDYSGTSTYYSKINFTQFDSSEQRLKAIRSGAISMIVAPTLYEIEQIKSDPTLIRLDCPFKNKSLKIIDNESFDKDRTSSQIHAFDLTSIIVRKSLLLDQFFLKLYQMHGISEKLI